MLEPQNIKTQVIVFVCLDILTPYLVEMETPPYCPGVVFILIWGGMSKINNKLSSSCMWCPGLKRTFAVDSYVSLRYPA